MIAKNLAGCAHVTMSAIGRRVKARAEILIHHEQRFNTGATRCPYFLENIAVALRSTSGDKDDFGPLNQV